MASALKLKNDIRKLKTAIDNKATNPKFLPKLKEQLEKLEGDLAKLKKPTKSGKKPYVRAEGSALAKLKNKLKSVEKQYKGYSGKTPLSLERDANRPAKPIGKRKSKSGNTYYEYRANRIDVKQPPRVFPKLEEGGMMAEGGYMADGGKIVGLTMYYEPQKNLGGRSIQSDDDIRGNYKAMDAVLDKKLGDNYLGSNFYIGDGYGKVLLKDEKNKQDVKRVLEMFDFEDATSKYQKKDGGYMDEGGYMKGGGKLSLKKFRDKYDENEDANMHSDNVVLLAENFGSDSDIRDAKTILAKHEAIGSLPYYLSQERNALHDKLWAKYQEEVREKGIKEDGGYMAGGGETPVENSTMKGKTITIKLPNETESFKDKVVEEYSDHVWGKKGVWSKKYIVGKAEDGGYMAMGGATEHGIMKGDHVVDIYEDTLVIENGGKKFFVFIKTGEREEVAEKGGYMTHGGETHRSEKK